MYVERRSQHCINLHKLAMLQWIGRRQGGAKRQGEWTKIEIKELCPLERRTGCTTSCAQHLCLDSQHAGRETKVYYMWYSRERIVYGDSCLDGGRRGFHVYVMIVFVSSYSVKHEWEKFNLRCQTFPCVIDVVNDPVSRVPILKQYLYINRSCSKFIWNIIVILINLWNVFFLYFIDFCSLFNSFRKIYIYIFNIMLYQFN